MNYKPINSIDFNNDEESEVKHYVSQVQKRKDIKQLEVENGELISSYDVQLQEKIVIDRPSSISFNTAFESLQSWEGMVEKVYDDNYFTSQLINQDEERSKQFAEFEFEEVKESDRSLIKPGAIFHWCVFRQRTGGTIYNNQVITFKRLPKFTAEELEQINLKAEERIQSLRELLKNATEI